MKLTQITLWIFLCSPFLFSQNTTITTNPIKTFITSKNNSSLPEIFFDLNETILVSFDELLNQSQTYYYEIIHCDINWISSNLLPQEYIQGYAKYNITNYQSSNNTLQYYNHYKFSIPNNNTKIIRTGNYVINILDSHHTKVASKKVVIYQQKCFTEIHITESQQLKYYDQHQFVTLKIDTQNLAINNPNLEIKTCILQNQNLPLKSNWLTSNYLLKNTLIYRNVAESDFNAGNEFLDFDNNDIYKTTNKIASNYRDDDSYHTILNTATPNINTGYHYQPDINGNFSIRNRNSTMPELDAEYSFVHFRLKTPKTSDEIYVYGNFNNYELTEETKMFFNETEQFYEGIIYLKQGFYNYTFVKNTLQEKINIGSISGNFIETENDYTCLVYYTPLNKRYYEVVGKSSGNSKTNREN